MTVLVLVAQSCWTLSNPVDCSPLGSSVHGIVQAKILEWVAILFCVDIPDPGIRLNPSLLHYRQILWNLIHKYR